jgi:uncharacterized protein YecT (DUF1311 family)
MSNRCLALLAVLVATAAGWPVIAADPPAGATRDCIKIADYREMVDCFAADSQAADVAATRAYEAMLAKLGPSPRRDLLRSSQEAWLAYRSAYCAFVSSAVEGGSFQPTIRNTCFADMARIRLKELEHQLTCREGDLSCVVPNRQP